MYRNSSGKPVLTDVDGNIVNASMFGLDSDKASIGDCVYMKYSNEKLTFTLANCSNPFNIVCLNEWPGMYQNVLIVIILVVICVL